MTSLTSAQSRIAGAIAVLSWSVLTAVVVKLLSQLTRSEEAFIGAVVCLIFFVLLCLVPSPHSSGSDPGVFQSLLTDKVARIVGAVLALIGIGAFMFVGFWSLYSPPSGRFESMKRGILRASKPGVTTTFGFLIKNVPQDDLIWVELAAPIKRVGADEIFQYYYTNVNPVPGFDARWAASLPIDNNDKKDKTFILSLYDCLAKDTEILVGNSSSGANNDLEAARQCHQLSSICVTKHGNGTQPGGAFLMPSACKKRHSLVPIG
jgi:hypothetical protein